jgi:hypothetical protein
MMMSGRLALSFEVFIHVPYGTVRRQAVRPLSVPTPLDSRTRDANKMRIYGYGTSIKF